MDMRVSNYLPYSYLYGAASASGRIAIPVPPSQLPYANFKNVAGTAASASSVYTLDKLKILDVLIDRLRGARKELAQRELPGSAERGERLDALIEEYGKMLHEAVAANDAAQAMAKPDPSPAAYAKPAVLPGMLVSFAA